MTRRILALLTLSCALLMPALPAMAHSQLASSDPADGARLSAPPASVALTFSEDLLPGVNVISINREDGTSVSVQQVEPEGPTIRAAWPAELTSGQFQVAYRVVSGDGHPITGAITFTITGSAASGGSSGSAAPAATPATTDATPVPIEPGAGGEAEPEPSQGAPVGAIIGLAALAAAVVAVIVIVRRRRA